MARKNEHIFEKTWVFDTNREGEFLNCIELIKLVYTKYKIPGA